MAGVWGGVLVMIILDPSQVEKTREVTIQGPFGVHDTLREGLKSVSHDLAPKHPLQTSLKTVHPCSSVDDLSDLF